MIKVTGGHQHCMAQCEAMHHHLLLPAVVPSKRDSILSPYHHHHHHHRYHRVVCLVMDVAVPTSVLQP